MRASIFVAVAAAAVGLATAGVSSAAEYRRSPAYNFSAPLYQSPGGVGRQGARTTPYDRGCGHDRFWNGNRCVDAREGN